jgi:hypothetical protein
MPRPPTDGTQEGGVARLAALEQKDDAASGAVVAGDTRAGGRHSE